MKATTWERTTIHTPDGPQSAIEPVIISASRATDIPAFHAEWFFRALEIGYAKWINPFNNQVQYVSFGKMRVNPYRANSPIGRIYC